MAIWKDARFALRQLRKSPGFTLIVIVTLAVCIGVNTAVFSVLDAVLLRGIPYPEPDRLALVVTATRDGSAENINTSQTGALLEAVRDHVAGLDVAASSGTGGVNFAANGHPEYIQQHRVSAGYFRVLGVAPADRQGIQPRRRRSRRTGRSRFESRPLAARLPWRPCTVGPHDQPARRAVHRSRHYAARFSRDLPGGCLDAAAAQPEGRGRRIELRGNRASQAGRELGAGRRPIEIAQQGPERATRLFLGK